MKRRSVITVVFVGLVALLLLIWQQNSGYQRIRRLLGQADPLKALQAYDAIAMMNPTPLEELLSVLKHGNAGERYGVLAVFERMPSKAEPAIPEVISALSDSSPTVRRGAAACLAEFGLKAKHALPRLEITLHDSDSGVAFESAIACWRITGDSTTASAMITNVMPSLTNTDLEWAIKLLGQMGEQAQPAAPTLEQMLKNSRRNIRFAACEALAMVDSRKTGWIVSVVELIRQDKYYSSVGVALLARHAPTSMQAMATLSALEHDPDPRLQRLASDAVKAINAAGDK